MSGFVLILILLLVGWLCLPYIMRWLQGFIARRIAKRMSRMMGGDATGPRGHAYGKRQERNRAQTDARDSQYYGKRPHVSSADMMRNVAEDIPFTEVHEFSKSTLDFEQEYNDGRRTRYHESQVEDVRYVEIPDNGKRSRH